MSPAVEYEQFDGVAVIRMRRPEAHNALDATMLSDVLEAVEQATRRPAVRAIVLTGGREAFTTGEDLYAAAKADVKQFRAQMDDFQRLASALRHAPKPTIAAVAGYAYGGGLEIAVNCDIRIAASNAKFACPELQWGLTLTNGSSLLLRRLVGEGWARELLLLGTMVDGQTAERIGLVTRLVEVDALEPEALRVARGVASFSTEAVALTKELLNADPQSWEAVLEAETMAVVTAFASEDVHERLERFAARERR